MLNLSVVICTYNSKGTIKRCLQSVKTNNPREIILVDAGSQDQTINISKPFADKILFDKGKGLGNARNMGLIQAKGKYIVFVGPDNIMPNLSLLKMINYLEKHKCAIISAVTILKDKNSYLGWAQNSYRLAKYKPGFKQVVGTPTFFKTKLLRKYKYDSFMKNSDDTDICERMAKDGHKFAIADVVVYEIGCSSFPAVWERWTRYGRGDCLFYIKYAKNWSLRRKFHSWIHPFSTDFIVPLKNSSFIRGILIMPFLILITALRYYGWLKTGVSYQKK